MKFSRRQILAGVAAAPAVLTSARLARAAAPKTLKISHQFPGGTIDSGDFRDRLCRKFAQDVEKRTIGALKFDVYPGSSLMKTVAQFSAVRKGALDLSLYPLAYAGGEVPEVNIGLMPCLVTSYQQGLAWKKAPIGQELTAALDEKGVKIVTWIWQAGGVASRSTPIVNPNDVKGLKIRGGSREMDQMLKEAGGIISSVPSNEIYPAMQTGSLDAAVTSSTSLISFRLEEISKNVTSGVKGSFWFMLEPLIMSKDIYDGLPKDQQHAIMQTGEELEKFALDAAKNDDVELARSIRRPARRSASSARRRSKSGGTSRNRQRGRTSPTATPTVPACSSSRRPSRREDSDRVRRQCARRYSLGGRTRRASITAQRAKYCPGRRQRPRRLCGGAGADLGGRRPLFLQDSERLARRAFDLPADRRDLPFGRMDTVAARPCRHRSPGACLAPRRRPGAAFHRRCRIARILHLLLLALLGVADGGLGRRPDQRFRLGSALVDSVRGDGRRDDGIGGAARAAGIGAAVTPRGAPMSLLAIGLLYGGATLVVLFSGIPIAFALGTVAVGFMMVFMPAASVGTVAQNVYE